MDMRKKSGFTLIELLVVIAIVGVLAGIVITSIGDTRNKAIVAGTKGSISSLKTAIAACCNEPGNWLATTPTEDLCTTPAGSILPDNTQLNAATSVTYTIINDCDDENPALDVELVGHTVAACDGHITVTGNGVYSGGDAANVGTTSGFPAGC